MTDINDYIGKTLYGDSLDVIKTLPDNSVQCCITSPPYWGLRDYGTAKWEGGDPKCEHKVGRFTTPHSSKQGSNAGSGDRQADDVCPHCGAIRIDSQLGLEKTPEEYVANMVALFREVRRVLKDDGTLWLNLGDSYNGSGGAGGWTKRKGTDKVGQVNNANRNVRHLKPKDLVGIPWMVAFALRADGWYLRQDIIWCLSGGTWVYARTQKGEMPIMVRDLYRLKKDTVRLWNGKEWTPVVGMSKSKRSGQEIEIVLRSGERISCTKTHKFPSSRGLVEAGVLQKGDRLFSCKLPDATHPRDSLQIGNDAAWLAGLYLAEGSRSEDTIQIAGHSKEEQRWERIQWIAKEYGGSATRTISGNKMDIRIYGKILNGIIDQFVSGKTAHNKCFSPAVWKYSNNFIESMLRGYLAGDGYWDEKNSRWRLGFCRNYNLERDLRTVCARLGYRIVLNMSESSCKGKKYPSFRGEIRMTYNSYRTQKDTNEIIEIRNARCREVYDIGVLDEPHEFALASGVLTHNSKPNPMPESVTDRCTKAHEYIFLMAKSARYYFDNEAIKEDASESSGGYQSRWKKGEPMRKETSKSFGSDEHGQGLDGVVSYNGKRNKRSVWTVCTKPYKEAHFATFPPDLIEPCVKAGCPEHGIILDPFMGSGTTAMVAERFGRNFIGIELNPMYIKLADNRVSTEKDKTGLFNGVDK